MVEIVKPFTDKQVSAENDNIGEAAEAFVKLAEILEKLRQLLDHEIDMNRVASKEVKEFAFFKVEVFHLACIGPELGSRQGDRDGYGFQR